MGGFSMENQLKELFGAWIQAIGSVTAAVGSTPSHNEDFQKSLHLWGNALQATGNALIADAEEELSLGRLGDEVEALGNAIVIAGLLLNYNEEIKKKIEINGNMLQAVGGGISLAEDLMDEPSTIRTLHIAGNVLQIIGNILQVKGDIERLNINDESIDKFKGFKENNQYQVITHSQSLEINGGWIQAVGSVLSAVAHTKENIE
jgi:hypothetical protein